MNHRLSLILYILGITGLLVGMAHAIIPHELAAPPAVTSGEEREQPRDEISPAEELA